MKRGGGVAGSAGDWSSSLDSSSGGAEDEPDREPGQHRNDEDAADDDAERGVLGSAPVAVLDVRDRNVRTEEGWERKRVSRELTSDGRTRTYK
jgi:hypothetical protein